MNWLDFERVCGIAEVDGVRGRRVLALKLADIRTKRPLACRCPAGADLFLAGGRPGCLFVRVADNPPGRLAARSSQMHKPCMRVQFDGLADVGGILGEGPPACIANWGMEGVVNRGSRQVRFVDRGIPDSPASPDLGGLLHQMSCYHRKNRGRIFCTVSDTWRMTSAQLSTNASSTSISVAISETSPSKKNASPGRLTLNGNRSAFAISAS